MSPPNPRKSGSVRILRNAHYMGAPAACVVIAILAANQAATRSQASLPYLKQGEAQSLRFAQSPPNLPLPTRPWQTTSKDDPTVEVEPTTTQPDEGNVISTTPTLTTNPQPATTNTPPTTMLPPNNSSGGVELIPDSYAPRPVVRIDDLLPFFLAPTPPVSRATYELK